MNNLEVAIAGVKIVAKILNFPAPELYIMEQSNLPNQEITGESISVIKSYNILNGQEIDYYSFAFED